MLTPADQNDWLLLAKPVSVSASEKAYEGRVCLCAVNKASQIVLRRLEELLDRPVLLEWTRGKQEQWTIPAGDLAIFDRLQFLVHAEPAGASFGGIVSHVGRRGKEAPFGLPESVAPVHGLP